MWFEMADCPPPIAAYQPCYAPTYRESLMNCARWGTYTAAAGVAPAWAGPVGWTFNGTTQYLDSGVGLSVGCSVIVQFSGATTNFRVVLGVRKVSNYFSLVPRYNVAGGVAYYYSNTAPLVLPAMSDGNLALVSTAAKAAVGYRNGVLDATIAPAANFDVSGLTLFLGAENFGGVPVNFFPGKIPALGIYLNPLSPAQVAVTARAMAPGALDRYNYWKRRPTFWQGARLGTAGGNIHRWTIPNSVIAKSR